MELDEYRKMYELEENFWWYRGMWKITQNLLDRYFKQKAAVAILDAGCGTGSMLQALRQFSHKTPVGFDFSAEAIKFLKIRGEPSIFQALTTDIPVKDQSFDLVTSFDVLCQLPSGGDVLALNEFYRVLKPKGKVYVRLPAYQWMYAAHDKHSLTFHRYTLMELVFKVKGARLKILQASYANFFLFPILAAKRLVLEKVGILADSSDLRPIPKVYNKLLELPLHLESRLLRYASWKFPWGLSLVCLAEKA